MIKEASFYRKTNNSVICELCPADCVLSEGKTGICGCRKNENGILVTDNYGELVTLAIDPIEKKPLYHFHPGTRILSTGANGCNLSCLNCQNWKISQEKTNTEFMTPEGLLDTAISRNSVGVAFTYTEPMIWYEYIVDCAKLLRASNLKVVLVSNGYINQKPLEQLIGYIDAINVDLKSIRPEFYTKVCKGNLQTVLNSIKILSESDVHLEVTNLIVPGKNDTDEEFNDLTDFIASLSDNIPLHLSAFHPDYKMDAPATSVEIMSKAYQIAREKLKYVFVGNINIPDSKNSICPNCDTVLIEREFYQTRIVNLEKGKCLNCNFETGIVQ